MTTGGLKFPKNSFRYIVNVDWDSNLQPNRVSCNGNCDICRCHTITDIKVTDASDAPYSLTRDIIRRCGFSAKEKKTDGFKIFEYGIDRLCRAHKIYDPELWDVEAESGYYGDEIGRQELDQPVYISLRKDCESLYDLYCNGDTVGMVHFILMAEYGFVLPAIAAKTVWTIQKILIDDIVVPNDEYLAKRKDFKCYEGYDGILGVCIDDGGHAVLKDGYHRYAARFLELRSIKDKRKRKVEILYGE